MPLVKKNGKVGLKMKKQKKQVKVRAKRVPDAAFSRMNLAPVAAGVTSSYGRPRVTGNQYTGDGSIRVRRREFLGDVISAGTSFNVVLATSLNPGLPMFHWLSNVATQYDQYRIRSCRFIYETDIGTSTAGSVFMAFDYDASDAAPTTKNDIRDMTSCIKFPVYANTVLELDPALMHNTLRDHFIRGGAAPTNSDIKMYDVGNFYIATSYVSGSAVIGELSIEYDIDLKCPHLDLSDEAGFATFQAVSSSTAFTTPLSGVLTNYNPLLTGLRIGISTSGSTFLPRDAGMYLCILEIRNGTGLNTPVLPVSSDPGLVTVSAFSGATTFASNGTTQAIVLFRIEVFSSISDNAVINNGVNVSATFTGASLVNTRLTVVRGNSFV